MENAKYTPGPWTVGSVKAQGQEVWIDTKTPDPRLLYSRWDGLAVAYGCDEQPTTGAAVAMANARLIAAAPDLLEALQACADAMEIQEGREQQRFHLSSDAFVPMWTDAIQKARAAIAKAEGK